MNFYISPDQRINLERKLDKMFKHLEVKPAVTFGPVEQIVKETIMNYGSEGYSRQRTKIQAINVNIEDIEVSKWVLVATVDYRMGHLLMCDSRLFKHIPEQYGIQYSKCDHCGSTHKNRIESHILYNTETFKWMQVGSTCINKMINGGKYLNGLMLKLYNVIDMCGGCGEEEWEGGSWRPSKRYLIEGISMVDAMMVCNDYRKKVDDIWHKSQYDDFDGRKIAGGTNDALIGYYKAMESENRIPEADMELIEAVKKYYESIPYGEVYYEKDLNQKIKDAFENEFIALYEMYLAWFAVESYKKSLTTSDFEKKVKELGLEQGSEVLLNVELKSSVAVQTADYMGYGHHTEYECTFYDEATGLTYMKNVSSMDLLDKFIQPDSKYRFIGTVKYIAFKKQYIGLGGRLKKAKK